MTRCVSGIVRRKLLLAVMPHSRFGSYCTFCCFIHTGILRCSQASSYSMTHSATKRESSAPTLLLEPVRDGQHNSTSKHKYIQRLIRISQLFYRLTLRDGPYKQPLCLFVCGTHFQRPHTDSDTYTAKLLRLPASSCHTLLPSISPR